MLEVADIVRLHGAAYREQSGVFLSPANTDPTPVEKPEVLQGYIEGSNVTPLREMVSLVQIARAYEANQKVLTSRDQTAQKALESLG